MLRKLLVIVLLALGLAAAFVPMGCEAEIDADDRANIAVGD